MNQEVFFEKFESFVDAPGGLEKIQQMLLELAVLGKLVPQDPTDEPASILLNKIVKVKAALVRDGLIPKQSELPTINEDTLPFKIPNNWNWTRLETVCEIITKGSSPNWQGIQYVDAKDGVLFITSENVGNYLLRKMEDPKYVERRFNEMEPRSILKRNDLLVNLVGASIGRTAIYERDDIANINQAVGIIRLVRGDNCIDRRYLLHYLNSPISLRIMFEEQVETARANLSLTNMKHFLVPIPPLNEQKRIVSRVDDLIALCDGLEKQQQERNEQSCKLSRASLARFADAPTPTNLDFLFHESYDISPADLRRSILNLAVQGKLVPQDPNDEPAARVLERIDAAPKRVMRTRAPDEDEVDNTTKLEPLFDLPHGWEWAPFGRLPYQASVGLDRGRSMQGPDKAVGYFKMNNIRNSGGVDLSDLTRIDATPNEVEVFTLANGDFLFNTRNSRELVGKTCVFRAPSNAPILYNNNILRVKFIEGLSPDFLDYWFRSPLGNTQLEKLKSNTTNVCAIYQGKLLSFPCVVPPVAEQRRIVVKVEQLMTLVDALEAQLATARSIFTVLLDAVVHELTNGGPKHAVEV